MPRLIRPTQEVEAPAPLTDEMREKLDKVFGPGSQGQVHELSPDFEEKREAELQKMGLDNGGWQPDLRVTSSMGLQGTTAAELAEELKGPQQIADEAAVQTVIDINDQLEAFFANEPEIPLVPPAEEESVLGQDFVEVPAGAPTRTRRPIGQLGQPDPHLVPLEEQKTEEEGREAPQSLLQQVARPVIAGRPWSDWTDPVTATAELHHFSVAAAGGALALVLQPDNELATVTPEALTALGRRCAFPPEFIGKLPAELAAEVINDRIAATEDLPMTVLLQDGQWTAVIPAWRGVLAYRVACDTVYDTLAQHYTGIEVDRLETNGQLHLRLLTPVVYPVTGGDTLQMGVDLTFSYNSTLTVSLLVRRQDRAEMTAYPQSFSWRQRTGDGGSAERQLEWLQQAVLYAIGMFVGFVEKADKAAVTKATRSDLALTLRQLDVPRKEDAKIELLVEPLTTYWNMSCAIALNYEELQAALGDYVANWSE